MCVAERGDGLDSPHPFCSMLGLGPITQIQTAKPLNGKYFTLHLYLADIKKIKFMSTCSSFHFSVSFVVLDGRD